MNNSSDLALCITWPKYWIFSFSISLSSVYSVLISFKIDWLELLAVQRTLKSFSPAPQFGNFSSSAFSLFYGPTLTSIHDNWKNHSFDYTDLCWQSNVSVWVCHSFSSKEQVSFNFMAAVTVHSDFGAQENSLIENKYGWTVKDNFQVSRKKTMKPEESRCWNQSRIGISNQKPKRLLCSGKLELRR